VRTSGRSSIGTMFSLAAAGALVVGLVAAVFLGGLACAPSEPAVPKAAPADKATGSAAPAATKATATATDAKPTATAPDARPTSTAAESPTATALDPKVLAERRKAAIAKGVEFLLKAQAEDGSWVKSNVGISALCTDALLSGGKAITDPAVKRAVDFLLKFQKDDGGIYDDSGLDNYTTSIAVMVLAKADAKAYSKQIAKAITFLTDHQWGATESIDDPKFKQDPRSGGAGYGKQKRPDMSNTQFFVDALHAAEVPKDNPAWAKVVVFITRSQASSETNDLLKGDNPKLATADDGGFIYTPAGEGESKADYVDLPGGKKGLRTYGSMTYAGFKSFIYAFLKPDDPRVKAALDWARKHWTFQENPEVGQQGLYYYYQTAAKALKAYSDLTKEQQITDARSRPHDWRAEITEALLSRQQADGSWFNETDRWFEGKEIAPVPTSYAVIALVNCE